MNVPDVARMDAIVSTVCMSRVFVLADVRHTLKLIRNARHHPSVMCDMLLPHHGITVGEFTIGYLVRKKRRRNVSGTQEDCRQPDVG